MSTWSSLVGYRLKLYLSSNKIVVPIVIYLTLTYITYQQIPTVFISDAQVSATLAGYIMMWITFTFYGQEDTVGESILFCNLNQKKGKYYGSKLISLLLIGFVFSLFGVGFPFLINALKGNIMFTRQVGMADFFGSLLLHMLLCIVFISITIWLQPRMIRDNKLAVIALLLIAVVSISKNQIIECCDSLKYILWVFPPVTETVGAFRGVDTFTSQGVIHALLYGGIYSVVAVTLGSVLADRRSF